ncbi:MAG: hypothetical protein IJS34_00975 [Alphaproteobacteria bacterium]|nr:hypothetical protein [Alphaproteobacteria bacterium]
MKIKNLAFFGIMAAIMSVAGTARADTTTVIASQAYVDAKDALDEKTANKETATYALSTNKTSTTVYPSMATLKDAYDTLNTAISNIDVSTAVSDLDLADGEATGTGNVVKSVTQTDGQIAVTKGEIVNADVASNAAIDDSKIAFTTAHTNALDSGITSAKVSNYDNTTTTVNNATDDNVVATREANTNLLKGTGLQKAVAHLKGNGAENYTANVDNSNTENTGIKNETVSSAAKTAWDATLTAKQGDNYLTTLAAVERRVQEGVQDAVSQAGNNVSTTYADKNLSNLTPAGTAVITNAVTSGAAGGNYSNTTSGLTATTIQNAIDEVEGRVDTAETNIATNTASITTLNGDVSTTGSVLKAIKDNAENATFTPGNSGITATNLADAIKEVKTTAASGLAGLDVTDNATEQPVTAVNQTDGAIAVTRGTISYAQGLKYDLSNINTAGGDGSAACVQGSPCTLTMFMNNGTPVYEWTNMDTESTNAVL